MIPANTTESSLVLWGTNLRPAVFYTKYTIVDLLVLTYRARSIIIGLLLSDGWLTKSSSGGIRLMFKQSLIHLPYFLFVYFLLAPYIHKWPIIRPVRYKYYKGGKESFRYSFTIEFTTMTLPCLLEFYDMFHLIFR